MRSLGGPAWLAAARLEALERFDAAQLPSQAEEIWRYSRIDDLDLDAFGLPWPPAAGALLPSAGPPQGLVSSAMAAPSARVDLVDGRVVALRVRPEAAAAGLSVVSLASSSRAPEGWAAPRGGDPFDDLGAAVTADGLVVELRRGAAVSGPVVIVHQVTADGQVVAGRTLVRVGEAAELTVVEELVGPARDALFLPLVELDVAEAANLRYVGVQDLGQAAWQLGHQESRLARDANLVSFTAALGGGYARLRTESRLDGAGASTRLLAAYFGKGTQMHDFRTLQEHVGPKTTSDLLFKGAVQDEAEGVYSGLIRVAKGSLGANAFQTNRNLVLTEGARAWSVPNLEIEENDVRCSHASAVGPVDADQLYYLESRGVPPAAASRLIVLGFFQDLLNGAPVPEMHDALRARVAAKLGSPAAPRGSG